MDINFFEEFNSKNTNKRKILLFFIIIPTLLIIGLSLIMINNQIDILELKDEINIRAELITNPKTVGKLEELQELKSELHESKNNIENLNAINRSISEIDYLNKDVLEHTEYLIRDGIIISSINFNDNIIELSGLGVNPNVIGEYSTILRESVSIEKVHITSISLEGSYYNFMIIITLKGDIDEILS